MFMLKNDHKLQQLMLQLISNANKLYSKYITDIKVEYFHIKM